MSNQRTASVFLCYLVFVTGKTRVSTTTQRVNLFKICLITIFFHAAHFNTISDIYNSKNV